MSSPLDVRPVDAKAAVVSFRVWMRAMGNSSKIAVEAAHEAKWLIEQLVEQELECVDLVQDPTDLHCTFRCLTGDSTQTEKLKKLLQRMPEVLNQLSPEFSSGKAKVELSPHLSAEPLHTPAQPDVVATDVEPFRVWIRPLSNSWKIRVENGDTCVWLRNELEHRGLKCSPTTKSSDGKMQSFTCMSETPHEATYVWNLLKSLSQVLLQNDPA